MEEVLVELIEPFILVAYAVLAGALTLAGLAIEYVGVTGGGVGLTRLWTIFMGGVLLAFAVLVVRDKLLPELASRNP
jgi:hypothetical protein